MALSCKNPSQKRAGGVAQVLDPEFKPQYCKKKKGNNTSMITFHFTNWLYFNLPQYSIDHKIKVEILQLKSKMKFFKQWCNFFVVAYPG
jgi:hypothetical protein